MPRRQKRRPSLQILALLLCAAGACDAILAEPEAREPAPALRARPSQVPLARGVLLVANPKLPDSNFAQTVVLLLDYGADGALGLVVNRPTRIELSEMFPDLAPLRGRSVRVHYGGPVRPTTLTYLTGDAVGAEPGEEPVCKGVHPVTGSAGLERALKQGATLRAYAGHAGWAPGQLDNELRRGDWYVVSADAATVFREPADAIWPELIDWLTLPSA